MVLLAARLYVKILTNLENFILRVKDSFFDKRKYIDNKSRMKESLIVPFLN